MRNFESVVAGSMVSTVKKKNAALTILNLGIQQTIQVQTRENDYERTNLIHHRIDTGVAGPINTHGLSKKI